MLSLFRKRLDDCCLPKMNITCYRVALSQHAGLYIAVNQEFPAWGSCVSLVHEFNGTRLGTEYCNCLTSPKQAWVLSRYFEFSCAVYRIFFGLLAVILECHVIRLNYVSLPL